MPDEHPKKFIYFVDGVEYESDEPKLTGAQIKARVPNWDPTWNLQLDGHGKEPDRIIGDNETVMLEEHHEPDKFSHVPPTVFGVF